MVNKYYYKVEYICRESSKDWGEKDAVVRIGNFPKYDLKMFQDYAPSGWEIQEITRSNNPNFSGLEE